MGGSFNGNKFFLERSAAALGFASGVFIASPLETSEESSPPELFLSESLVSRLTLGLREVGKVGWSISDLGDSNAFGIAGTGGTSSSPETTTCSTRGFGVGRREDEEGVKDIRAWMIPEFLAELLKVVFADHDDDGPEV